MIHIKKNDKAVLIIILLLALVKVGSAFHGNLASYSKSDSLIPSYIEDLGKGFTFELKAHVALGTHGRGMGFNVITTYSGNAGSLSAGMGTSYYFSDLSTGNQGFETRFFGGGTLDMGKGWGLGYYNIKFLSGESSQHTGNFIASYKDWSFTFENDMAGDWGDRFRSHASVLTYKDMSLGLNLFTGDPGRNKAFRRIDEDTGAFGTYLLASDGEDPDNHRLGLFYFRYKLFRIGTNSEYIRHWTQNLMIHDMTQSPQFAMRDKKWNFYGGVYTFNPFTAW